MSDQHLNLAIVDNDLTYRTSLKHYLEKKFPDVTVKEYESGNDFLSSGQKYRYVLLSLKGESENKINAVDIILDLKTKELLSDIIVIGSGKNVENIIDIMKLGVKD